MVDKDFVDPDREPREPIRILLVEDQAYEAELTSRQLRASDIPHLMRRVETEAAMRAALSEFNPTIILSDFSLPQFDGLSALTIARECAPDIPFLFVSGTIGEERAIEALRRGAVDYVLKTNLARLGPAVRRALAEAAARRVREQQELKIARLTGVLRMLSGINSVVVRIRDRKELLHEACRLAVAVGGYTTAIVAMKDSKSHALGPVAWWGAEQDRAASLCALIEQRARRARSSPLASDTVTQFLYREDCSAGALADAAATAASSGQPADAGRAVVSLPLVIDKTAIGTLVICARDGSRVDDEELRMLREVAANLAFALQYLQKDRRVRLLSYFEVLTGLAKRELFCERLGRLTQDSDKLGSRCAVAVLDVENLSGVNDSFGRHAGDHLLQLVADRLKRRFQDTELLAHFAGGTFAVAQPDSGEPQLCLERLNAQLDGLFGEAFRLDGKDVPVVARTGVAMYPDDGREPDALVQKAEATLRTAKVARERHRHFSAQAHSATLARVALERKLRVALERQQFELHYQPKVAVKTRRIVGVEALIRWNEPGVGLVSPGEFLPILESSGMIDEVGKWVIERAAADCHDWNKLGLPSVRVAVNISPVQLRAADFVAHFLEAIEGWATATRGLDIEITEGALIDEYSGEVSKLKMLRTAGVSIAIDDFGTGYSSLSRLSHLPIDTLKIDRSFVGQMTTDPRAKKLVSSMISIARAFKMLVVAEGVESQEQLDALWQLGCDQSQGYLHCKPVTRDEFGELLKHGKGRFVLPHDALESGGEAIKSAG
jgi:diguanylate cyclase (GGDEF)-like protein